MKIDRRLDKHGNIDTELSNILKSIPEDNLFYKEHNYRHPLAIYNRSRARFFGTLSKYLDEFEKQSVDTTVLVDLYIDVLSSLEAFYDDTFLIFKCLFSKTASSNKSKFAKTWLESIVKKEMKDYQNNVDQYNGRWAHINNRLKHDNGRLFRINIKNKYRNIRGYFLDIIDDNGSATADSIAHPLWNSMRTASSYNYETRDIIFCFYAIGHYAKITIFHILKNKYNIQLSEEPCSCEDHEKIYEVLTRVSNLDKLYYENEATYDVPDIEVQSDRILLCKPLSKNKVKRLPQIQSGRIQVQYLGDGFTTTYGLIYFMAPEIK